MLYSKSRNYGNALFSKPLSYCFRTAFVQLSFGFRTAAVRRRCSGKEQYIKKKYIHIFNIQTTVCFANQHRRLSTQRWDADVPEGHEMADAQGAQAPREVVIGGVDWPLTGR